MRPYDWIRVMDVASGLLCLFGAGICLSVARRERRSVWVLVAMGAVLMALIAFYVGSLDAYKGVN